MLCVCVQFCNIIGNLGAYFVFDDVSASWGFFVVFLAIGVVGTLLMLLLREARPEDLQAPDSTLQSAPQSVLSYGTQDERERDGDSDGDHGQSALPVREASGEAVVAHATVVESLTESFALMRRPVVLLLCPMFFLTGTANCCCILGHVSALHSPAETLPHFQAWSLPSGRAPSHSSYPRPPSASC